ncbi:helix-turn-helix transcriptional regulator [Aestuariicoccus sp. MJ-SS9]|uniref:helix-turn-helix domain-containing protein n=1 Tax=Aestuariicoccus sp. MJ-SS9 TaxID=3079855 RepID=UPI0029155765|nr:helix-turn-helix transcriptional regulator [Aestuariicoccus sp. MJ-SS9]MDU8910474.1 helix-turn-helix transcriptional regulator [Aestuariicoccus sp. MJ-SS9]
MTSTIDALVGRRIKQRRQALRMTQSDLAEQIDVRFQQIQKYESGQNRVAASRLWLIARVLEVPVTFFFEQDDDADSLCSARFDGRSGSRHRDVVELVDTLSDNQKKALVSFLRSLSNESNQVNLTKSN